MHVAEEGGQKEDGRQRLGASHHTGHLEIHIAKLQSINMANNLTIFIYTATLALQNAEPPLKNFRTTGVKGQQGG